MNEDSPVWELGRRDLIAGIGLGVAAVASITPAIAAPVPPSEENVRIAGKALRVVDLTHRLTEDFNRSLGPPRIAFEAIQGSGAAAGMNLNRVALVEHTGTHIDVPRHFDPAGASLGELPLRDLIVPLVIVDLRDRAESDPDAALGRQDILAWEQRYGRLPAGCCVVIDSGWDPVARLRGEPGVVPPSHGSPGFSPDLAPMLIEERQVKGVGVDAMSLDRGSNGPAYPFHQRWLRSGRWGLEGLTNLAQVPRSGATLIVGAPPIEKATGFPVRALALF